MEQRNGTKISDGVVCLIGDGFDNVTHSVAGMPLLRLFFRPRLVDMGQPRSLRCPFHKRGLDTSHFPIPAVHHLLCTCRIHERLRYRL